MMTDEYGAAIPVTSCARCGAEHYDGEVMYQLPEGWCCAQCGNDWLEELVGCGIEALAPYLGVETKRCERSRRGWEE